MTFILLMFSIAILCLCLCSIFGASLKDQIVIEDCSNYNGLDSCKSGFDTSYGDETENRMWQAKSETFKPFQIYGDIQAYAGISYSADRSFATVKVVHFVREPSEVFCSFGSSDFSTDCSATFSKKDYSYKFHNSDAEAQLKLQLEGLVVTVKSREKVLILDPIYFLWQNPVVPSAPQMENGQKGAIIEMFGWPFEDVEKECEFIGKAGYMGVKVFPASEHVESFHYLQNGELNPWYFQYQPVSYRLNSRLGTRKQLRQMIVKCRNLGVRVYADAVINHMSGGGNDVLDHRINRGSCVQWGPKNSTSDSPYYTHSFTFGHNPFTKERPALEFPAVPYHAKHFHCERSLNDWNSPFILNYGWLQGLTDLNTEVEYVQQRISEYLTDLLSIGFSGIRIDAAKHIKPDDLGSIFGKLLKNMGGKSYPPDFISWLEVILGGEGRLLACDNNPYNYYTYLDSVYAKNGIPFSEIQKLKIWSSDYPKEFPICGYWKLPQERFVVQNDDHDQQNPGSSSRDMQDKGSVLIKERNVAKHRWFERLLFDRRDANFKIKLVLSSYSFMNNGAQGYPDGKSECKLYKGKPEFCKSVPFQKAYDPSSCGYSMEKNGKWLEGSYTRVHRDKEIVFAMRRWMGYSKVQLSNAELGLAPFC